MLTRPCEGLCTVKMDVSDLKIHEKVKLYVRKNLGGIEFTARKNRQIFPSGFHINFNSIQLFFI